MIWETIKPQLAHIDLNESQLKRAHEHYERTLPYVKGKRVLDYGCGGGYYCELVKDKVKDYYGYDISERSLKEAKNRNPECMFTYRLPTGNYRYQPDIIICLAVIQHCNKEEIEKIVNDFEEIHAKEIFLNIRYGDNFYTDDIVHRSNLTHLDIPSYKVVYESEITPERYKFIKYDRD